MLLEKQMYHCPCVGLCIGKVANLLLLKAGEILRKIDKMDSFWFTELTPLFLTFLTIALENEIQFSDQFSNNLTQTFIVFWMSHSNLAV